MEQSEIQISKSGIRSYLKVPNENIFIYDTLNSTNETTKEKALTESAPHGTVVIARSQSAGKGRRGKSFISAPGGIYMSIVLRSDLFKNPGNTVLITTAAAVKVCEAIFSLTGKDCQIKWVNDIFLNSRKLCGILTESTGNTEAVILGIGINVVKNMELEQSNYGWLYDSDEEIPVYLHNRLIACIMNNCLSRNDWFNGLIPEYKRRCFILGKEITVEKTQSYKAIAVDIDYSGHLLIEKLAEDGLPVGTRETLSSGEISIKL
jgi:BirA family biotin operon repressor/biotin-[acetyl-CoA-carboxylase] ligase